MTSATPLKRCYGLGESCRGTSDTLPPRTELILSILKTRNVLLMMEDGGALSCHANHGEAGGREIDDYIHRRSSLPSFPFSQVAWKREELASMYASIRAVITPGSGSSDPYGDEGRDCTVIGVDPSPSYPSSPSGHLLFSPPPPPFPPQSIAWRERMEKQRREMRASRWPDSAQGWRLREKLIADNILYLLSLPTYSSHVGVFFSHALHVACYAFRDSDGARYKTSGWRLRKALRKDYSAICFLSLPIRGPSSTWTRTAFHRGCFIQAPLPINAYWAKRGESTSMPDPKHVTEIETAGAEAVASEDLHALRFIPDSSFDRVWTSTATQGMMNAHREGDRRYMTFPRDEWDDITRRLREMGHGGTTRVEKERGRWYEGETVDSPVGPLLITSVTYLRDALRDHPFRKELALNPRWVRQLEGREGDWIVFSPVTPVPSLSSHELVLSIPTFNSFDPLHWPLVSLDPLYHGSPVLLSHIDPMPGYDPALIGKKVLFGTQHLLYALYFATDPSSKDLALGWSDRECLTPLEVREIRRDAFFSLRRPGFIYKVPAMRFHREERTDMGCTEFSIVGGEGVVPLERLFIPDVYSLFRLVSPSSLITYETLIHRGEMTVSSWLGYIPLPIKLYGDAHGGVGEGIEGLLIEGEVKAYRAPPSPSHWYYLYKVIVTPHGEWRRDETWTVGSDAVRVVELFRGSRAGSRRGGGRDEESADGTDAVAEQSSCSCLTPFGGYCPEGARNRDLASIGAQRRIEDNDVGEVKATATETTLSSPLSSSLSSSPPMALTYQAPLEMTYHSFSPSDRSLTHRSILNPTLKVFGTDVLQYFHHRHHSPLPSTGPAIPTDEAEYGDLSSAEARGEEMIVTHHCGRWHTRSGLDYIHHHCQCGKHVIDRLTAVGHDEERRECVFKFTEHCPFPLPPSLLPDEPAMLKRGVEGKGNVGWQAPGLPSKAWHVESGVLEFYLSRGECEWCHVSISSKTSPVGAVPCDECGKVFYCSEAHREEGREAHAPFHADTAL
jgi:hypothetical protein